MKTALFIKHKYLILGLILLMSAVCGLFLARVPFEETILTMVPQHVRGKVELFTLSPLNQKIFVGVQGTSEDDARKNAETLREMLLKSQVVREPFVVDANVAESLAGTLPYHFSEEDEKDLSRKITPDAVAEKMTDNYAKIISLQGMFLRPLILKDPLDFVSVTAKKLALLGKDMRVDFKDGFLSSSDGKTWIGVYDSIKNANDFSAALSFDSSFWKSAAALPASVRAFYTGGLRYTVENVRAIKRDLVKISVLAFLALSGVFVLFFRRKSALLIYLLPLLVLPPAALGTYLIFGRLSGITLGFGSVAAGLAVDYSIYVFFAVLHSGDDPYAVVKKLKKHLLCNYMTSVLCFAALLCSGVEVFRQIAVFSILALTLALGLSLFVFPAYWINMPPKEFVFSGRKPIRLSGRAALPLIIFIVQCGIIGLVHTTFSGDMDKLNAISPRFEQDKELFSQAFPNAENRNALLFVLGKSKEDVLRKSEELSGTLPRPLAVSQLLSSEEGTQLSLERWRNFWSEEKRKELSALFQKSCDTLGIQCGAFEPFLKSLEQPSSADPFDLSQIYNPLIQLKDGRYALVHIVPNYPIDYDVQDPSVVFVSAEGLRKEIISSAKWEALRILLLAILFNSVAVGIVFKSVKSVVAAFLPVLMALCILFACFALFGVEVNLFILVFMPLLIGLGIDYAIFQLMKQAHFGESLYPNTAVVAAGLSTLAGFGVLIVSTHPVLFMMGLSSVIGITGAVLASMFLLEPFIRGNI